MRVLPITLLVCLPLLAFDAGSLRDAVGRFGSDDPDVREEASRVVRTHLERELAPLLEALSSKDPEVSRRAHDAIASLLPYTVEAPEPKLEDIGVVLRQAKGRIRLVVQGRPGRWGRMRVIQGIPEEKLANLKQFGIEGRAVHERFLRRQLRLGAGRGFLLTGVMKDTTAAELGLEQDDIILRMNDEPAMQPGDVVRLLDEPDTWPDLKVRVLRDGDVVDLPQR